MCELAQAVIGVMCLQDIKNKTKLAVGPNICLSVELNSSYNER